MHLQAGWILNPNPNQEKQLQNDGAKFLDTLLVIDTIWAKVRKRVSRKTYISYYFCCHSRDCTCEEKKKPYKNSLRTYHQGP